MERFRNEYEKLHRALKTSYESEKRLVKRYGYTIFHNFLNSHFLTSLSY
jgi:hypothetical protein